MVHVVARGGAARAWAAGSPNVYVKYSPQQFAWFASLYETGVHGVVTRARSYEPAALDPKAKHLSRLNMSLAELEANDLDPGAWAVLTDGAGNVTEGTSHNVFAVTDGVIRTPTDKAVLGGISRGMVLDLTDRIGMPAREEDLQPYDLYTADECFFSGTSFSVLPVTEIDRRPIGDGKPGPVVQRLLAAWSEDVGIDIVAQAVKRGWSAQWRAADGRPGHGPTSGGGVRGQRHRGHNPLQPVPIAAVWDGVTASRESAAGRSPGVSRIAGRQLADPAPAAPRRLCCRRNRRAR